jgi:diacylglycerol kinase (ATP)
VRVAVLANPASGQGLGLHVRERLLASLRAGPHDAQPIEFGGPPAEFAARVAAAAAASDVLVVAGGDGTVHHCLPAVAGTACALYHFGLGTENLFAREFAMVPDADRLAAAVGRGLTREIDLGLASWAGGERLFAVMASLGPDAGVIRRLHASRTGPISHWSYAGPVFSEFFDPAIARLSIDADDRPLVPDASGLLVVGNMKQYGWRADPAVHADPADGLLDVVFMPCSDALAALGWLFTARRRRHTSSTTLVYRKARSVRVRALTPRPALQFDGEPGGLPPDPLDLSFSIAPRRLRVLLP